MVSDVTQWMVDQLVKPEVQAEIAKSNQGLNMDPVRLAWPFKTEKELKILAQWHRKQVQSIKKKQIKEHIEKHGEAFL
jgi:hypothetical protein